MTDTNQNTVISQDQLARMSDAELVEAVRLTGGQLIHNTGIWARGALVRAAAEMEAELDRRLPDGGAEVAEEVVTDAAQLPPGAAVETPATGLVPAGGGMLVQAGAGAAGGWLLGRALGKKGVLMPIVGAVLGVIFRPVRGA